MFRLLSGGARIVFFGLCGLGYLASLYPWQTGIGTLILVACYLHGVQIQRKKALGLDLRAMSPVEYEQHCAELLRVAGWSVRHVGSLGDQGVDVVASLRGTKAAIQCKRYTKPAGNSAVQEIVAGKRHYGAQIAVVACPVGYTRAAKQLAQSNAVLLLSHRDLSRLEAIARVP